MFSHPELCSDLPIGSDQEPGCDTPCRWNIFFRYRERSRRRLILEADFEESRVVALMFLDNMY